MNILHAQAEAILSRQDLVAFIAAMGNAVDRQPADWENTTLSVFLEALAAWTSDMDGFFASRGSSTPSEPTWRLIGQMLVAALVYE